MATRKTTKTADTEKTAETKAAGTKTKATAAKRAEKKTAEAKKAEKKSAAKTTSRAAKKKEMKVTAYVEYHGKKVEEKTMIANVKKAWTKSGGKVGEIKSMDLYIKPEEDAVYYVINGTETGSVAF